jgi:hypothetical protein
LGGIKRDGPTTTGLAMPCALASAKACASFCWNALSGLSPSTAGSLIRAKQPDVVKLRNGDIKKNWSDASVFATCWTSSASDVSISSSKNDKNITNDYHLNFGSVS